MKLRGFDMTDVMVKDDLSYENFMGLFVYLSESDEISGAKVSLPCQTIVLGTGTLDRNGDVRAETHLQ